VTATVGHLLDTGPGGWTLADLDRLPDNGTRQEIIDGSLLVSPAPSVGHQGIAARLVRALNEAAPAEIEAVEAVGVDLRSPPQARVPIPDVVVTTLDVIRRDLAVLRPRDVLLAVEIVSPSSRAMDRLVKPAMYAEAGIATYWRIEREGNELTILEHALDGDAYGINATVHSGQRHEFERPFPIGLNPADLLPTR